MAQNYYRDPRTGRRSTRDAVSRLLSSAMSREAKWGTAQAKAMQMLSRSSRPTTVAKWQKEVSRTQKLRLKAAADIHAATQSLYEGDGRGKEWRYRMSFSYLTRKRSGATDEVFVDVLLFKDKFQRASEAETRHAFRQYLVYGVTGKGWNVQSIAWQHKWQTPKGHSKTGARTAVHDPDEVEHNVRRIFAKLIGGQRGRWDERGGQKSRRRRNPLVIGEEEWGE